MSKYVIHSTFDNGHEALYCTVCDSWGNDGREVVHDEDCAAKEVERLRGLIAALHCVTSTQPLGRDCIEVKAGPRPEWKMCQVCKAKEAANG